MREEKETVKQKKCESDSSEKIPHSKTNKVFNFDKNKLKRGEETLICFIFGASYMPWIGIGYKLQRNTERNRVEFRGGFFNREMEIWVWWKRNQDQRDGNWKLMRDNSKEECAYKRERSFRHLSCIFKTVKRICHPLFFMT